MASFDLWIDGLLKVEGGYAPRDNNAGAVNRGITQQTLDGIRKNHPELAAALGLPLAVIELTLPQTKGIYRALYWDEMKLDQITGQTLANLLGHMGVNQGTGTAVMFLQHAVVDCGATIPEDGRIGALTIAAANTMPQAGVYKLTKYYAMCRYARLAIKDPVLYGDDILGWLARLESL